MLFGSYCLGNAWLILLFNAQLSSNFNPTLVENVFLSKCSYGMQ